MPRPPRPTLPPPRHQRPSARGGFCFGVAYYPEHWSPTERRRDLRLMRDAGINVVRMGEFAWDVWEPRPGAFDFSLFDETIAALGQAGIRTILGTPTAAPPRWLTLAHPEILRETAAGQRIEHGARQHANLAHPIFQAASRQITQALATHYARNRHVIGWQTDNEFHCIGSTDFSPQTGRQFQAWLRRKYRRIDALNRRWGTRFSANTYDGFDGIPLPIRNRPDGLAPHPAHLLDFHRFTSDTTCAFNHQQVEILRAANPRWFVLHNGIFPHLDYWKLAADLDTLGVDLYPGFGGADPAAQQAWSAGKLERCRAHSGSFVVPELASGAGGARDFFLETPEPGQMRLWAWQCVAHGADGIVHFRWRTIRSGQETYWRGVLDHDSVPRRRFQELQREAREFATLAPALAGTVREVTIGVLIDLEADESHDALLAKYPPPRHQADHWLTALLARHLPAGLIHARDRLDGLDTVVLPSFGHVDATLAKKLAVFVRGGGRLICTAHCGALTKDNQALPIPLPGPLRKLLGVTVEEAGGFRTPRLEIVSEGSGPTCPAPHGYEILRPHGAKVIGCWRDLAAAADATLQPHPAHATPALTHHKVGRGLAITVGTWVGPENAAQLVDSLAPLVAWQPLAQASATVTVTCRRNRRLRLLFLLNHEARPQTIRGLPVGRDLLTGNRHAGTCLLPPYGVVVLRVARGRPNPSP
jgi:beta-galactosidase